MSRRAVRTLAVAVVLGTLTNVLVTGWCVYAATAAPHSSKSGYWEREDSFFSITEDRGPAKTIYRWSPCEEHRAYSLRFQLATDPSTWGPTAATFVDRPPRWSSIHSPESRTLRPMPEGGEHRRIDVACGWPLRSFAGGMTWPTLTGRPGGPTTPEADFGPNLTPLMVDVTREWTGLSVPITFTMKQADERTVPLVPLLPGVLVNTAAYAGAWWVLLVTPGAVRRRRRRRRGACMACGYDRRGLDLRAACPECGAVAATATGGTG